VPGRFPRPGEQPLIQIFPNVESLSLAAVELFQEQARRSAGRSGRFVVILSGGSTPKRTYEILAAPTSRARVPWDRVHVFWGDERCVPGDDPRKNARMAREAFLEHVPVPETQIHPVVCSPSAAAAAAGYEELLRGFFGHGPPRCDLVLLGLGEDGHTASLFPGSPVLEERERWVRDVPGQDFDRVTLTAPFINRAAAVVFLVAGAAKARVVREVIEGVYQPHRLPAQLIHPVRGALRWLLDRDAAAELEGAGPSRGTLPDDPPAAFR